ncbi:hypothetical protein [Zhaonella formicivorans]|jgi:tRNA(Ile2) C34 agmatinyltransferase TiaS|uniref:hypothetical protein n=1 Tax=Zhaonella formicivorans TaxID=2528593 RepID=UPI0010D0EC4E|nr:hypothetical protein [Zhaonella formicivorans]
MKYTGKYLAKIESIRNSEEYNAFVQRATEEHGYQVTGMFRAENGRAVCINCGGHLEGTGSGRYRCDSCDSVAIRAWVAEE